MYRTPEEELYSMIVSKELSTIPESLLDTVNVNCTFANGSTPLMEAVKMKKLDVCQGLLNRGARVNAVINHETILNVASFKSTDEIVALLNIVSESRIVPKAVVENRSKATRTEMEKEWEDSALSMNDQSIAEFMSEIGIYKNVYEQYNWYLDQVFEKHSDYFRTCMERLNQAKQNMYGEYTTLADVVYFQAEYQHKIIGDVYMGFSEHEVKKQFGLPLESLLIFLEGSECYSLHRIKYTAGSSKCLIAQLKTRMLSNDNVEYLTLINSKLPSVLSEAVDVISKLAP